jgi:hypothetical protein
MSLTPTEKAIVAAAVQKAAEAAGMYDYRDAAHIMDRVRLNDDGFVYGHEKAIAQLKAERPHLFKPEPPGSKKADDKAKTRLAAPAAEDTRLEFKQSKSARDMSPAEVLQANKDNPVWRKVLSGDGRF